MSEIFRRPDIVRATKSRQEMEEFGPGKAGAWVCSACDAYYHKKSWHHNAAAFLGLAENRDLETRKTLCPADKMIADGQWEGQVLIRHIPASHREELKNLVENYCARAWEKDPLDRLISAVTEGDALLVKTTENQLAQRLAEKIKDAFSSVDIKITHDHEPSDVTRVVIEF